MPREAMVGAATGNGGAIPLRIFQITSRLLGSLSVTRYASDNFGPIIYLTINISLLLFD